MDDGPKFPHIEVELVGHDGNAFAIIGTVIKALKRHNVSQEDRQAFQDEAMSGSYDHLLYTVQQTVTVL